MAGQSGKKQLPGVGREKSRIRGDTALASVPVLTTIATGIIQLVGNPLVGALYFSASGLGAWGVIRKHRSAMEKVALESELVLLEAGAVLVREAVILCSEHRDGADLDSLLAVTIYEVSGNVRSPLVQVTREIGGDYREPELEIERGIGAVGRAAGGGPLGAPRIVVGNRTADDVSEFRKELNERYGMPMSLVLKVRQNMQSWLAIPTLKGKKARYVVFLDSDVRGFFPEFVDEKPVGNTAHALKLVEAFSDYISR